jgi:hypothetical protein
MFLLGVLLCLGGVQLGMVITEVNVTERNLYFGEDLIQGVNGHGSCYRASRLGQGNLYIWN